MITKNLWVATLCAAFLLSAGACNEKGLSFGDANSIIAVMPREQWDRVEMDVYDALEKTIATVRDEKTFTVTYQEPLADFWGRLRRFRQILVVGSRSDVWVQEILDEARDPITENGIHQARNVWSLGQMVTLVLLDEGWDASDLVAYLPAVNDLLDAQYKAYARRRMYVSGVDSALADTLATEAGFLMYLPKVYRWQVLDSVYIFRNDNPTPAELIRQVSVTWMTPAADRLDADAVLEWRARVVEEYYSEPQEVILDKFVERSFDIDGNAAYQLGALWQNPPSRPWPAGGPLITRIVTCDSQDRTYLLDAWLYAPGKEKYEYMIQLETLLDSFRCIA